MYFKFSHIKRSLDVGSFRHGAVFILSKSAVCFPHAHASLAPYGCRSSRNYLCTSMFQAQRRNGRIIPFLRKKKKKQETFFSAYFNLHLNGQNRVTLSILAAERPRKWLSGLCQSLQCRRARGKSLGCWGLVSSSAYHVTECQKTNRQQELSLLSQSSHSSTRNKNKHTNGHNTWEEVRCAFPIEMKIKAA